MLGKVKSFVASCKNSNRTKTVKYLCTIFESPEELRDALIAYCKGEPVTFVHEGETYDAFRGVDPVVAMNYGHGLKLRGRADSSAFMTSDQAKVDALKLWVKSLEANDPRRQEFMDAAMTQGTSALTRMYDKYADKIDGFNEFYA